MIHLKLKAEFEVSDDPFVLKLLKNSSSGYSENDLGSYHHESEKIIVESKRGRFEFNNQDKDSFDGDVILCIPEANRIQRLYRANSKNNTFLFTERCDQMCAMCSQPPRSSIDQWRFPHFKKAIELCEPDSTIGISGGEPTLFKKDLFDILENTAEKRPDVSMHILTNGQHFDDHDVRTLSKINKSMDVLWGIPLYSHKSDIHDQIVGKKGAFEKLMENLFLIASTGAAIELRTVLVKKNALDLPKLANFISKHLPFINKWAIMAMEPIGFAKANRNELFFDHSVAKFPIHNALDITEVNGVSTQLYNFPLCTIDHKYRKHTTKSISDWKNKYLETCNGCKEKEKCCGFFEWYQDKNGYEHIGTKYL